MNKANLKSYAPKARLDFIKAVTERANVLGISAAGVVPAEVRGDVALIDGREWPAKVVGQRDELIGRIKRHGFEQTMDEVAYTWFNRFAALRYMEIHDYLGHGWRVLSSRDGGLPEILRHASEVTLPGLSAERAREMQLAGNQDSDLYRLLLVAQCNDLSGVMPFLFERIDDETELLLPENLLRTDSIVANLVQSVPEDDWKQVEVIGWLYQFYISEKKDQVMGKVVKSEDIPAATQLFTPNWIVKYMVQNSLGMHWLATYPESKLKGQMAYLIEHAEQPNNVRAQLAALTPNNLDPEQLTLIDPACGSGHILVEAYELFKAIYLERGYRERDIPQLILERNLFGLDIDERAAQLTGFALMMKARADDRRLFERGVTLNVMTLVDSSGFDAERLAQGVKLADYGLNPGDLTELKRLFEHAKTLGSLIQVPQGLTGKLAALKELGQAASQDLFVAEATQQLQQLVRQAERLAARYDAMVANPPYMGSKGMNPILKGFIGEHFPNAKGDVFAAFMERTYCLTKSGAHNAMVTIQGWMFLSTFESLRKRFLSSQTVCSLVHIGFNSFPTLNSKVALAASFAYRNVSIAGFVSTYIDLNSAGKSEDKDEAFKRRRFSHRHVVSNERFSQIPGSPMAYWASEGIYRIFDECRRLGEVAEANQGLATADNDRFVRAWTEVSLSRCGFNIASRESAKASGKKWFPFNKGGPIRKWFGNCDFVVNWENDGAEIRQFGTDDGGRQRSRPQNMGYYFRPSISWSDVTFTNSFRQYPEGFIHGNVGHSAFGGDHEWRLSLLAYCNNKFVDLVTKLLSPSMHFDVGYFGQIPYAEGAWTREAASNAARCVTLATADWNAYERSWDFRSHPLASSPIDSSSTLESTYAAWIEQNRDVIAEMKRLEEENNRRFIDAYGLADELTADVPIEQVTLTVNPAYRYGGALTEEEQWARFRVDSTEEFVSYAVGCIMGRYSLDAPGLIYAHSGNENFDSGRYRTFQADDDGIVPVTDEFWFDDDATNRVREFLRAIWGVQSLERNMAWLANNLGSRANETPDETLRRYLADGFFRTHLQSYRKRPIYWLFSSGKQGAFQALIYLHRYNEGTLARLRSEYALKLLPKMEARLEALDTDLADSTSAAARAKTQKRIESLRKKHAELLVYEEKLRHYADMRIKLNLDDGVKLNYAKFGDLVAESKTITGDSDE